MDGFIDYAHLPLFPMIHLTAGNVTYDAKKCELYVSHKVLKYFDTQLNLIVN